MDLVKCSKYLNLHQKQLSTQKWFYSELRSQSIDQFTILVNLIWFKKKSTDVPVKMVAEWSLYRKTENMRQSNLVNGVHSVDLSAQTRQELLQIVNGKKTFMSVENICPKFLKVSSISTSNPAETLMIAYDGKIIRDKQCIK